jgi:ABC-2 type transport system permease protein
MNEGFFQPHAVAAIARRELRSCFETPTAYIALVAFYLLAGYGFCPSLFLYGQASIKDLKDLLPLLLCFLAPALTMGLLAEELKSGTFETLATLPLEDSDIVLGKFLGYAQVHAIAISGLLYYVLMVWLLVQPPAGLDWGETLGTLFALLLLGWVFGAIGLFASSLTRSQVSAFVAAFLACFLLFTAGRASLVFSGAAGTALEFLGAESHVAALSKGVVDARDLLYFASLTGGFLFAAVERLRARRGAR